MKDSLLSEDRLRFSLAPSILALASLLAPVHSGQAFSPAQPLVGQAQSVQSVHGADLDGDGDLDLLSASSQDDRVAWYENLDGLGSFGGQRVITEAADFAVSVFSADIDGDGDEDVLSASRNDGAVRWFENLDGAGNFGPGTVLATDLTYARWVRAADLDGDGDADVLAVAQLGTSRVVWYENLDGLGSFGPERVITTAVSQASSVAAEDLDGDGDADALLVRDGTPQSNGSLRWFENTDGLGSFGPAQFIAGNLYLGTATSTLDADGDGDLDVLASLGYTSTIVWEENTNGAGSYSVTHVIVQPGGIASSFYAGDLDGDGDADAVRATASRISWNENVDGLGSFGPDRIVVGHVSHPTSLSSGDLDGDGNADVLVASTIGDPGAVAWVPNAGGDGQLGGPVVVASYGAGVRSALARDLDGDGDEDLLTLRDVAAGPWVPGAGQVEWFENLDGAGTFGPEVAVHPGSGDVESMSAADLDGDGDEDVLVCTGSDGELLAYGNTDGLGSFSPLPPVVTGVGGVEEVVAVDLDGDGDLDLAVASGSSIDDALWWHENQDGAGSFGPRQPVVFGPNGTERVAAGDLDGDGDQDLLSARRFFPERVEWHANADGAGSFSAPAVITDDVDDARSLEALDLDGDGDVDVLLSPTKSNEVSWTENTDGAGAFGPSQVLGPGDGFERIAHAADLDGDGFPDVLTGWAGYGGTAWHRNLREPLMADVGQLSLTGGGSQVFDLTAGAENGSLPYFLAGSSSGTVPGTGFGGAQWPLNLDAYTLFTLDSPNGPVLESTFGVLAPNGKATAKWNMPAGLNPALAGLELHHAYGVFDLTLTVSLVSNPVPLLFVP